MGWSVGWKPRQEKTPAQRTTLPQLLDPTGFAEWATLEKFYEIVGIFKNVFGNADRVGVSREGFNTSIE